MISMLVLMVLLLLIIHFDNRTLHYNMAKLIVGLPLKANDSQTQFPQKKVLWLQKN